MVKKLTSSQLASTVTSLPLPLLAYQVALIVSLCEPNKCTQKWQQLVKPDWLLDWPAS